MKRPPSPLCSAARISRFKTAADLEAVPGVDKARIESHRAQAVV